MNYRLLQYKLPNINYSSSHTSKFKRAMYSKLLSWYIYNKTGDIILGLKVLKLKSAKNLFKSIDDIPVYKAFITEYTREQVLNLIDNISPVCKECGTSIKRGREFCSIICANKSRDISYRDRLSASIKKFHHELSPEDKHLKNLKISESMKDFYENESEIDKINRISNNTPKLYAYESFMVRIEGKFKFMYSKDEYYNNTDYNITCVKCDSSFYLHRSTSPLNPICRTCNPHNQEKAQQSVLECITLPFKINDRTLIKPYELDIIVPDKKLAIEYNGLQWHTYGKSKYDMFNNYDVEDPNRHLRKTEMSELSGYQLLHIFEHEWLNKRTIWESMIQSKLGTSKRIYARKCKLIEINSTTSKTFTDISHIQGHINASINVALTYEDEIVAVMTLGKSRFDKTYQYEIYRYCNSLGCTVVGGFSKILKYFEKTYNPTSLISYANRRWSTGNVYISNGFDFIRTTKPNFYWVMNGQVFNRQMFQKHKLGDIQTTASEEMFNRGYRRLWDSGNLVYSKSYQ